MNQAGLSIRLVPVLIALALSGIPAQAQVTAPSDPFTPADRVRFHALAAAGLTSQAAALVASGVNQWRDHPDEWGQGMAGYGRRFGYRTARTGVAHGIQFAAGIALGEDPRYYPSESAPFWTRTCHAITQTFVTRHTDGRTGLAISRLASHYGSAWIANAWSPPWMRDPSDVALRGTISIGWNVASNVFTEFWPDIRNALFGRARKRQDSAPALH